MPGPPSGGDALAQLQQALASAGINHDPIDMDPMADADPQSEVAGMFGIEAQGGPSVGSSGAAMDRVAKGNQYTGGEDGLPGSRLVEMYQAWIATKLPELVNQLGYERYYHGKQFTPEQLAIFARRSQPPTYFNELRKKVDSYIGIEQRLRRDPKAQPRTPKHEGDCDAATAALREVHDQNRAPILFSEAGRDFFVRGIGAMWQGAEQKGFTNKVELKNRRIPAIQFIYDPRSMDWDFADAKFLGEWTWMDIEDAEELFDKLGRPDSADMMRSLSGLGDPTRSGGVPGEWSRVKSEWWSSVLGRVRIVHLYYRYKGQWRCCYFCGAIKLYDEPSLYVDEDGETYCPIIASSCNVDEGGERYGVVKDLIPIQDAINARHSRLLWMMSVRQIIADKGAVDDVNHAREQAKRPDGVIMLNPRGKDGIDKKFQIVTLDSEIAGQAKLLEVAVSQMANYGPNPAMMGEGQGTESQSGRAILAKQNAGMTEMSPIFERHREFKITSYRRNWLLVRQFWTQELWFSVTDDDKGFKFIGINQPVQDPQTGQMTIRNDVAQMDVNIIIEEGPDTVTMNEELMDKLAQMGPTALTPMGKILITLSGVPNKDRLFALIDEATAPNPQAVAMQAKMAELEALLAAAKVDSEIAKGEKTRADAMAQLVASMATPQMFQEFPIVWGSPTIVSQMGGPGNPNSTMNAFMNPVGVALPGAPGMPPGGPAPPSGGPPLPRAAMPPPPPVLPGQAPRLGQPGGMPVPPQDGPGAPGPALATR